MLQSVERNAHKRGVGYAEDAARLKVQHPDEGNYLSPKSDKVFLIAGQVRGEKHVHQIVSNERMIAIAANQVHWKQLLFVR